MVDYADIAETLNEMNGTARFTPDGQWREKDQYIVYDCINEPADVSSVTPFGKREVSRILAEYDAIPTRVSYYADDNVFRLWFRELSDCGNSP